VDVRSVSPDGVAAIEPARWDGETDRRDGFVWVDLDRCDDTAESLLRERYDVSARVIQACRERVHLPTGHGSPRGWFVVLHRPLIRRPGHVHLIQLELIIRSDALITVHGPANPDVPADEIHRDIEELRARLARGRLTVATPSELAVALVASIAGEYRAALGDIATRVAELEQEVMGHDFRSPEGLLDRMFLLRHELMTIRTMAGDVHEVFDRLAVVSDGPAFDDRRAMADLADRFARIRVIADGERDFLAGVIDYYQTKTSTKMTVAMERLAVLAAVTLPITALASIYGMNVIVNAHTDVVQLIAVLVAMLAISGLLLRWTKRQGWW
jgi:Mg2+ and Co2+ transporter CorA